MINEHTAELPSRRERGATDGLPSHRLNQPGFPAGASYGMTIMSPAGWSELCFRVVFLLFGVVLANLCFGASSGASSVIPTSGDSIKYGDVIFFRSDAPIFTQEFPDSTSAPASSASADVASTVAADLTKMAADAASDAAASKTKADAATVAAASAAEAAKGPNASDATKAAAKKAAADAVAAATDRDSKVAYSTAVSQAFSKALTQAAAYAADQAKTAKAKSDAADLVAAEAVKAATEPNASPATKAAAAKATADAATAHKESDSKAASATAAAKAASPAATGAASPPAAATSAAQEKKLCAPMYSRFNVQSVTAGSKVPSSATPSSSPNADSTSTAKQPSKATSATGKATQADTVIVIGSFASDPKLFHGSALPFPPPPGSPATTKWLYKIRNPAGGSDLSASDITCNNEKGNIVAYDVPYEFTSDEFQRVRSQRMGFTWGGLVVPYKFYVSDRSFQSNSSAVGYVGYEGYFPGVSLAGIVALGPGTTSTTQTTPATTMAATTSKTTTAVTYTAATGVVATFGGAFKFGLVAGWDWQGHGQGFKYEGKTWVALSIGAGF